jgi:hypothetical protein
MQMSNELFVKTSLSGFKEWLGVKKRYVIEDKYKNQGVLKLSAHDSANFFASPHVPKIYALIL